MATAMATTRITPAITTTATDMVMADATSSGRACGARLARRSGAFRSATEFSALKKGNLGVIRRGYRLSFIPRLRYGACTYQDDADRSHRSGFDMAVSGRGGFAAVRRGVGLLGDRAATAAAQKRSFRMSRAWWAGRACGCALAR